MRRDVSDTKVPFQEGVISIAQKPERSVKKALKKIRKVKQGIGVVGAGEQEKTERQIEKQYNRVQQ